MKRSHERNAALVPHGGGFLDVVWDDGVRGGVP